MFMLKIYWAWRQQDYDIAADDNKDEEEFSMMSRIAADEDHDEDAESDDNDNPNKESMR